MASKPTRKLTAKQYEEIGRAVEAVYQTGYSDRKQLYKMSFIKGALAGFGGVLGATVLVAILLWVLNLVSNIDLLKPFVDKTTETIQKD